MSHCNHFLSQEKVSVALLEWSVVKYMQNMFKQHDIRQLLFCLITLANVI